MPTKVYSKLQREEIRVRLLETGLALYSKHGIQKVRLMDILQVVGISKPFFYTYFESVQEFVVRALEHQWHSIDKLIEELEQHSDWKDKARGFLERAVYYSRYGFFVMTQEEQVWVRERISEEHYRRFMDDQARFFASLLRRWGIPQERCAPEVLGNLILSAIITYNSTAKSLPFLYQDIETQVAEVQVDGIIAYLETLR